MFTGLVQAVGSVESVETTGVGRRIVVNLGDWAHRPSEGDSIAVDGCCLTVAGGGSEAGSTGERVAFDAVPETLAKTTLGGMGPGDRVNLEHAVTASTLMGGHFVQGHVDGVGRVEGVTRGEDWRVRIAAPSELMAYLAPKGSVCVSGVSLTLAEVDAEAGWFEVALIPTTLDTTTLRALEASDRVNLEADMIAKTVVHHLRHFGMAPSGTP